MSDNPETGHRLNPRSPREAIQPEPAPPPPGRSRHVRNPVVMLLNLIMTLLVVGIVFGGAFLYWGKLQFDEPGPLAQDKTIMIPQGATLDSITGSLERQGVISEGWVFSTGVRIYKNAARLKAGEYLFKARASMQEVMDTMVEGKAILHGVTIPEGFTSEQVVARLNANDILIGDLTAIPPEGSLLPDTYKFNRGTTRQQVIERMKNAHERALDEIWNRRADDLPIETPEELVILASIVEKETGRADERSRVAGVFINRLKRGMRLESDPTILYGLHGGSAWQESRTILRSELNKPNDYNTYQINGLPPGPIANPGRAAMEAVANPSRTDEIFFVADGTGGHQFSSTLEQHNRNVARWREVEKKRREEAEKAAAEKAAGENGSQEQSQDGADTGNGEAPAAN
ncbi:UPF0755 protein [Rhodobium orientis]|uniref:Endolytic murein transglycosylase n=1 Tax=Rhodobium orientis TaxID=34017 RepID=A0A327JRL4_9HYPH|nr:endolytic transglycosylase MltG [Rhodobium orientis]MBB4302216.1 UPF0755 protein [Rhodobium orientis]MBK5948927.1 4-amino-4-deoxychorismate lyase [Rhodobium orientis]RAI28927.1 4-amino-4-deoxychorismate lyase [Rhodobium orientis]